VDDWLIILDFLLTESEFYKNVFESVQEIDFFDSKLKIITLEELPLLKTCPKLLQHSADFNKIHTTFKNEIDHGYLKLWSDKLNTDLNKTKVHGQA
jgi:hypothetical protein